MVERLCNSLNTGFFPITQVGTWMHYKIRDTQSLRPLHFIH
jgi:hypothetical protein